MEGFFETPNQFSQFIEQLAHQKNQTCFDTLLEYCTENYIEPDDIKKMISASLKEKIEVEVRKENKLPRETAQTLEDE